MKLTTKKILDYYEGFTRLDGYPRAHEVRGNMQLVMESYDLSPKAKWMATVNRHKLRVFKDAFEDQKKKEEKKFADLRDSLDPKMDPKESMPLLLKAEKECNDRLAALGVQENEVEGLMKLPGEGIRIRGRDPGIIALLDLLMDLFIDGEPDYGQKRAKKEDTE